jgi:hypothetical protein
MSALFEARATKERVLRLRECAEYQYVFSHRSLKRTLCLICRIPFVNRMALVNALAKVSRAIYFHSLEIFIMQIGEIAFCKPEFIIIIFRMLKIIQNAFALVRERRFRALVFQNGLRPHSSARTSISHTTMRHFEGNILHFIYFLFHY